ncbi:MAG: hypothetical protein HY268_30770 [Deltaproteobacteria bacterium]|nr:hypothetical protein [Deltaproteobacteria bacterium]
MPEQANQTTAVDHLEPIASRAFFDGAATFNTLQTGFTKAAAQNPGEIRESFYTFAGQRVRFRIVGHALAQHLTAPFSHLRMTSSVPPDWQLTIDLWDEKTTGIRCQPPRAAPDSQWTELTVISPDHRFVGQRQPRTLTCFDRATDHLIGSLVWQEPIFIYEQARPLARPLLQWYNDHDVQVIHSGLVAWNNQGLLFVGKGGSGKSTSVLACVCRGRFAYLSDDHVGLLRLPDGSFLGHSLYNSTALDTNHLARVPLLAPYALKGSLPKQRSALLLADMFPERLVRVVPIRVLFIPRITNARESKISPASKGQALLALSPSSLLLFPSRSVRGFVKVTQLVEQVPCYWLESGYDLASIPRCIEEFLATAILS